MTAEELKELGFIQPVYLQGTRKFYNFTGCGYIEIPEDWEVRELLHTVFTKGFEAGRKEGEEEKMKSIRLALGIDIEDLEQQISKKVDERF